MNCPSCNNELALDVATGKYACASGHVLELVPAAPALGQSLGPNGEAANRDRATTVLGSSPDEAHRGNLAVPLPAARPINPVRKPMHITVDSDCVMAIQGRYPSIPANQVIADFVRAFAEDEGAFVVCGPDRNEIGRAIGCEVKSMSDLLGRLNWISERLTSLEKQSTGAAAPQPQTTSVSDVKMIADLAMQIGELKARLEAGSPRKRQRKAVTEAKDAGDEAYEKNVGPLEGVRTAEAEPAVQQPAKENA